MKSSGIDTVIMKINALPEGGTGQSHKQDVAAINATLLQNRRLNLLLLGLLYERATTGPKTIDRFTQLKQVLRDVPAESTFKFRFSYYTLVRKWPLLLCVKSARDVSQSLRAISIREEDLVVLHKEAAVTKEDLSAMLAVTSSH